LVTAAPRFPDFRPLAVEDRGTVDARLRAYEPRTSELTFAHLFMWRHHYETLWCLDGDALLLLLHSHDRERGFALPPVGPPSRVAVTHRLLDWMTGPGGYARPRVERADRRLVDELAGQMRMAPTEDGTADTNPGPAGGGSTTFVATSLRGDFDYVYRTEDLAVLAGRRYHAKRNHVHQAERGRDLAYQPLTPERVAACRSLVDAWCGPRQCDTDPDLAGDRTAALEALDHLGDLGIAGSVVEVNGRVMAFALTELLNPATAVVHAEKADPSLPELYAVISQRLAAETWRQVPFINREQDLDDAGLRRSKLSYHPDHLEEKIRIELACS
jgi:hypothetical protein